MNIYGAVAQTLMYAMILPLVGVAAFAHREPVLFPVLRWGLGAEVIIATLLDMPYTTAGFFVWFAAALVYDWWYDERALKKRQHIPSWMRNTPDQPWTLAQLKRPKVDPVVIRPELPGRHHIEAVRSRTAEHEIYYPNRSS